MMKLKQDIDYKEFLFTVRECIGEVYYKTPADDCLNLKSILSEYVFITVSHSKDISLNGNIECEVSSDYALLSDYLENL
jgi:hypothetical protein